MTGVMSEWKPDILGDGFEQRTLDLGEDHEGPVIATLVRSLPPERGWWRRLTSKTPSFEAIDVLYVHGWSDYFFQRELAQFWTSRGARFFALDLRKYGRSYREGQTYGYVNHLDEYDTDIEHALAEMDPEAGRTVVLLGHSTGGLILSLWAARNPGAVDALILNSPWLEFQLSSTIRRAISPLVDMSVKINPLDAAPQFDTGFYSRAQHEIAAAHTPLDFNEAWRPQKSMPIRAGWMQAILRGHDQVSLGLGISVPLCVLLSQHSVAPTKWSDQMTRADTVLDVDNIAKAALDLGSSVTIERIDGAIHDIFLSREQPRRDAYERIERWVTGFMAWRNR